MSKTQQAKQVEQQLMWTGEIYRLVPKSFETVNDLPAGSYVAGLNQAGELLLKPQSIVSDRIVHIPSAEYDLVTQEIATFLRPETRAQYKHLGFIYKRSFFLYGKPGTGKSCLVNRVAREVVDGGGIVLVNTSNPQVVQKFIQDVRLLNPDRLILVVLEEFDAAIKAYGESDYLTMLDGQIQIDNVVYMATTNYIENIPVRLLRPGRFSRTLEIGYPAVESRLAYIQSMFPMVEARKAQQLAKATKGCSIDEVREVLQAHLLLGDDVRTTVSNLKRIRGIAPEQIEKDYDDEWSEEDQVQSELRKAEGSMTLTSTFKQENVARQFNEVTKSFLDLFGAQK